MVSCITNSNSNPFSHLQQEPMDLLSQLLDVRVHGLHLSCVRRWSHKYILVHRAPEQQQTSSSTTTSALLG